MIFSNRRLATTFVLALLAGVRSGGADATFVGFSEQPAALEAAVRAIGLTPQAGSFGAVPSGRLMAIELNGHALTHEEATRIGEFVRTGGSLLITLGPKPGTSAHRLAFLAPSTLWHTLGPGASR